MCTVDEGNAYIVNLTYVVQYSQFIRCVICVADHLVVIFYLVFTCTFSITPRWASCEVSTHICTVISKAHLHLISIRCQFCCWEIFKLQTWVGSCEVYKNLKWLRVEWVILKFRGKLKFKNNVIKMRTWGHTCRVDNHIDFGCSIKLWKKAILKENKQVFGLQIVFKLKLFVW